MLGKDHNPDTQGREQYPSEDTKRKFKISLGNVEGIKIGATSGGIPQLVIDTFSEDAYESVKKFNNKTFDGFPIRVNEPSDGPDD